MSSAPKFRVGEEVMVESFYYPEANGGPYRILEVISFDEMEIRAGRLAISQGAIHMPFAREHLIVSMPFYVLGGFSFEVKSFITGERKGWRNDSIGERALRRYHRPADQSYDQLMSSLKHKVTATV